MTITGKITNTYISHYRLKNTLKSIETFKKKIQVLREDDVKNIERNKNTMTYNINKAIKEIEDLFYFFKYIRYASSEECYNSTIKVLKDTKDDINKCNNNKEFSELIECVINIVFRITEDFYDGYYFSPAYDIHSKTLKDKIDYTTLQIDKINIMQKCISYTDREINYFNPCCFYILDEDLIKSSFENVNIYGLIAEEFTESEDYEHYIEENVLHRTIIELKDTINNPIIKKKIRISNSSFDILNIQPNISYRLYLKHDMTTYPSQEFYALKENIKYLRKDGILFYTIPFTRLTNEIMLFLSKSLKDISVIKFNNKDDYCNKVMIIGQKDYVKNYEENYAYLKSLEYDLLEEDIEEDKYILPDNTKTIDVFRGGKISERELDNIILTDNLYNDFYSKTNQKNINLDTQPLLPFNIGQIGLVLTSGKLDGVIEEPNNVKHIIKGRTIKYTESTEQLINNIEERVDKISNKVQINAFDASGKFIQIN